VLRLYFARGVELEEVFVIGRGRLVKFIVRLRGDVILVFCNEPPNLYGECRIEYLPQTILL